jgi:glycine/D-amino acid oxidase-like deaminating enzyme
MLETYAGLEQMLGARIFFPMRIRKIFAAGEQALWERRYFENDLENYISVVPDHAQHPLLDMPHGSGWVEKGGRTDLKKLLALFKAWSGKGGRLIMETFDYAALEILPECISYKGIRAEKIIFCEGHRGSRNPFFSNIRYKPVKGEILDLHMEGYRFAEILNKNFFLMPSGESSFRLGATYDHEHLDELPTEAARQELCDKLSQVLKADFIVTGHQAGIRPVAHDRRPVAGLHPQYPNVGIMNGLGAKGCLTGPYTARAFAAFLKGEMPAVPREIGLSRYYAEGK